jgi:hypothetical protein
MSAAIRPQRQIVSSAANNSFRLAVTSARMLVAPGKVFGNRQTIAR